LITEPDSAAGDSEEIMDEDDVLAVSLLTAPSIEQFTYICTEVSGSYPHKILKENRYFIF
jgi:hypothetical protein